MSDVTPATPTFSSSRPHHLSPAVRRYVMVCPPHGFSCHSCFFTYFRVAIQQARRQRRERPPSGSQSIQIPWDNGVCVYLACMSKCVCLLHAFSGLVAYFDWWAARRGTFYTHTFSLRILLNTSCLPSSSPPACQPGAALKGESECNSIN